MADDQTWNQYIFKLFKKTKVTLIQMVKKYKKIDKNNYLYVYILFPYYIK